MIVVGGTTGFPLPGADPRGPDLRSPGAMIIGVPKEVKQDEYRVAITPAGVRELTSAGHTVYIEQQRGSRFVDPRRRVHWPRGPRSWTSPPTSGPSPTWSSG